MSVDLLGGLTVQTYLDGALQESASAGSLLNLALFGGTPEKRTIGFNTTLPFHDEVRVRASSLAALAVDLDVYNGLLAPASCLTDTVPPTPMLAPASHDGTTPFTTNRGLWRRCEWLR
ncbi:MAG: hypothetical protein R2932_16710 [Caldilineaceae bacterium]